MAGRRSKNYVSGLLPGDEAGVFAYRINNDIELSSGESHSHPYHQFLFIVSGAGEAIVRGRLIRLQRHDFLILRPGVEHELKFPPKRKEPCDVFQIKALCDEASARSLPSCDLVNCSARAIEMTASLSLIAKAAEGGSASGRKLFLAQMNYLCALLADCLDKSGGGKLSLLDSRVQATMTYIDNNINRKLNTRQLAKLANLEKSYFIRLFSANVGMSPLQYVMKRKLECAANMFSFSSATAAEVSSYLKFASYNHFSDQFLKAYGCRPSGYRRFT